MQTVLIVIHLLVVLALIGVVLIQRSEGGGLGIGGGGGGTGGFFTARGTANVLTRATAILAGLFFLTSLALTMSASWQRGPRSILTPTGAPAQTAPGAPKPGTTILDQISPQAPQGGAPQGSGAAPSAPAPAQGTATPGAAAPAPSAPMAPSGPQVPQSQ